MTTSTQPPEEELRSRPFPQTEYANRLHAVQARMVEQQISSLVVVDPANLYYLTGYNAWSFYMPQCLIVPVEGAPHLFARAMDAQGAHYTASLPRDQIHGYPEYLVQRKDIHPFDWIAERALETGALHDDPGTFVAAETDAYYFSPRGFFALHSHLRNAALIDSHELVNWVRVVKSPLEQEKMRQAGRVATKVMKRAIGQIEVGRRQCDVVAEIQRAQALGARKLGGDYPAIVPMLPTGVTAGTPHLTWSDLPLVAGEATTIELAGVHHRYHAPLARTVVLGRPPNRLRDCAATVSDGMAAALDQLRPGNACRDAQQSFATTIARQGLQKESRIGYSIGIGYPPDWGERTVSLRSEEDTEVRAGMAFHVILGMWMDGWGYETSESVLIGEDGPELLTKVPRDLTVKE